MFALGQVRPATLMDIAGSEAVLEIAGLDAR